MEPHECSIDIQRKTGNMELYVQKNNCFKGVKIKRKDRNVFVLIKDSGRKSCFSKETSLTHICTIFVPLSLHVFMCSFLFNTDVVTLFQYFSVDASHQIICLLSDIL